MIILALAGTVACSRTPRREAERWQEMSASPLRSWGPAVWTGKRLVVWGEGSNDPRAAEGNTPADGAAYDPSTNTWSAITPLPFRLPGSAVAWTGSKMLVSGGLESRGRGLAYDPAADSWTEMASGPTLPHGFADTAWTGTSWLFWGLVGERNQGATYDPATNTWRSVAASPLAPRLFHRVAPMGTKALVLGGSNAGNFASVAETAAYDPATDSWARTAPWPLEPRDGINAVWTGRELLAWGGSKKFEREFSDGAAYDPATDTWRVLSPSPLAPRQPGAFLWSGKELLVMGEGRAPGSHVDGAAYDPVTDRWRPLPAAPFGGNTVAVWTGTEALLWGSYGVAGPDPPAFLNVGARLRPHPR